MLYDFLERKNAFLGYKNKKVWSKNGHFSNFFFSAIQRRKMFFTMFLNEETPFSAIKTRSSKSREIEIFPKGLIHGSGPKMAIFATFFFLGNIGLGNGFYHILERKNVFLGYKNKKFKSRKI